MQSVSADPAVHRYGALSSGLSSIELLPCDSQDARIRRPWSGDATLDLLARMSPEAFVDELGIFGISAVLARRGYHRLDVAVSLPAPGRLSVSVWRRGGRAPQDLLIQMRLWREYVTIRGCPDAFRALGVEWLLSQDPDGDFSPQRPRLPGQQFPGAGGGNEILALLRGWARRIDADVVTAIPEYFHSAVLFNRAFSYADGGMQGIFEAACRDLLQHRPVADASWLFEWGLVLLDDTPYLWPTELQVLPVERPVAETIATASHQLERRRAYTGTRFRVSPAAAVRWPTSGAGNRL